MAQELSESLKLLVQDFFLSLPDDNDNQSSTDITGSTLLKNFIIPGFQKVSHIIHKLEGSNGINMDLIIVSL